MENPATPVLDSDSDVEKGCAVIESISIEQVATYAGEPADLTNLSKVNFLFGSNGSGKTTISRIIADEVAYPTCRVLWRLGTRQQALVFNSDFVERNFNQSSELRGVFTLGEKQVDVIEKIEVARRELDDLTRKIENLKHSLEGSDGSGGKIGELASLEDELKNKCWVQKQKHDEKLRGAFEGYRNSAERFKTKTLEEADSNKATPLPQAELERKAQTVFGPVPKVHSSIAPVDMGRLLEYEVSPILRKRIIGKDDVDIAAMIRRLGNSDWVRQGRGFYEQNRGVCPFCQRRTEDAFAQSLNEYFDEAFASDSIAVDQLVASYAKEAIEVQQQLASLIASETMALDIERVREHKDLFDSKVTLNNQRLEGKKVEPSQIVELESVASTTEDINLLIASANAAIAEHNETVVNLTRERETLTAQVWRFVLEEIKTDLSVYFSRRSGLRKAIVSMEEQKAQAEAARNEKQSEIYELERQVTSVQPTIDGINKLLRTFGFQSFELAKAKGGKSYKLVRSDGADAKATLSEGEKNFVTFLYFYHLLKGSDSESGTTADRVVVIDDPVSSLDSEILFIVASLIKGLFDEVRQGTGHIKQIFVLTHNVYFHREVAFNARRVNDAAMSDETFWIIRKAGLASNVVRHDTNPIKTSYEMLWAEVRNPSRSILTIQNTLRRILENYFKILGRVDPDEICGMFEGKERLICKALFSWVNAGSHHVLDDLYVAIDEASVSTQLKVFRAIFEKSRHLAHYQMMMGEIVSEGQVET